MNLLEERYLNIRRQYIANQHKNLNDRQLEGVLATQGPLLLLAGAGSGKTTVLIHRIANLLRFGCGSDTNIIPISLEDEILQLLEQNIADTSGKMDSFYCVNAVRPYEILAITFTNKAANELKARIERMVGEEAAREIWASTFHSACVRILRQHIDRIGYSRDFTIYDTDDAKHVVKDCLKELNFDEKTFPIREILNVISKAKDKLITAEEYLKDSTLTTDWRKNRICKVYSLYSRKLREANALDFDDIILKTVELLQSCDDVREYYQRKFRYVLVDEYQDTNHLQYLLTSLLAGGYRNLCVVGDDDQSIYRFRGANIENILSFEKEYPNARVIKLEQNYRSTQNILNAANQVIAHNVGRKGKKLWTSNAIGEKIVIKTNYNEQDEANFVVNQIMMNYHRNQSWKDHAILYRMNAQSNALEYALRRNGIPYKIVGGLKFFDRAEIKDVLAYLSVINNETDELRLRRIINIPSRKIGAVTLDKAQSIAYSLGIPLFDVLQRADDYPELTSSAVKLKNFTDMINKLRDDANNYDLVEFYSKVLTDTGYLDLYMGKEDPESRSKLENIQELASSIQNFIENNPEEATLAGFLDDVALYSDLDETNASDDCVILMTMHSAKGLEFPHVFIVGMEDGLFPGSQAFNQDDIEEERRLFYVAITRAKEHLYLLLTKQRMLYGRTTYNRPSRFLNEMDEDVYVWQGKQDNLYENDSYSHRESSDGDDTYVSYKIAPKPSQGHIRPIGSPIPTIKELPNIQAGDCVKHDAFGTGLVISIRPMGGDALVEIAFDTVGTKKLMLKAASQHLSKQ